MRACKKCNNTNIILNGVWRQCAGCGEVHEKQYDLSMPSRSSHSLNDIILSSFKSTMMEKLISRFRLIH